MKGIYLTEEGKKAIENRIDDLIKESNLGKTVPTVNSQMAISLIKFKEEILSSATILPVKESWDTVEFSYDSPLEDLEETYPNGVIIQPKQ
jgi:hypothetical protein